LSNNLLDKWLVRPGLRKRPHIEQIGAGKPLHVRKFAVKVGSETLDDLCSPAGSGLAFEDLVADVPVEKYELPVYGKGRMYLRGSNHLF
jgi:hypothetical protein